jgi:hypothetical protein
VAEIRDTRESEKLRPRRRVGRQVGTIELLSVKNSSRLGSSAKLVEENYATNFGERRHEAENRLTLVLKGKGTRGFLRSVSIKPLLLIYM